VAGDENRGQRLTGGIGSIVDNRKRFNAGNCESNQFFEHLVFAFGEFGKRFFDGNHMIAEVSETHGMARKTLGQSGNPIGGPLLQRQLPR
jgi:hypothetical protein